MSDEAGHADYGGLQWIGGEAFYTYPHWLRNSVVDGVAVHRKKKEKRKSTREDAVYGVFGEEEDTQQKRPRVRHAARGTTATVSFVSSGLVQEREVSTARPQGVEICLPKTQSHEPSSTDVPESNPQPTSFGQKDGALRRQKEEREKEDAKKAWKEAGSTGFACFEQHSRGIASKLMQKMGYKPGEGLGKRKQGVLEPIVQRMRPKSMGMGYGDFKEQGMGPIQPENEPEEKIESHGEIRPRLWKASAVKERRNRQFKTSLEVVQEVEEAWKAPVLPTILDMRGPKARVLTDLVGINEDQPTDTRPMPELQQNMDLLVEMTENEIKNLNVKLKTTEDIAVLMGREEERLQEEAKDRREQLQRRKALQERLEAQIHPLDPLTQSDDLLLFAKDVQTTFPSEFHTCKIPLILLEKAALHFEQLYQGWDPLGEADRGLEEMLQWKGVLSNHLKFKMPLEEDPFGLLLVHAVVPSLRSEIVNSWTPRNPGPLLTFLDTWKDLFPRPLMQYLCRALLFPKLKAEVEKWDPKEDSLPVHVWIHPWLLWIPSKLRQLYPTILHKLTNALQVSEQMPWRTVVGEKQWTELLAKAILPKLAQSLQVSFSYSGLSEVGLQEYEVNPLKHDLSAVQEVMAWAEVTPSQHLGELLAAAFFPKWLRTLHYWLTHKPDLEEVSNWYISWKSIFPHELLDNPKVANYFGKALDCMNRAAEGLPIPSLEILVREEGEKIKIPAAASDVPREVFTLREMVQSYAEERNVLFAPKPGRVHEGFQVYSFGGVSVVLDNAQNTVRGQFGQLWKPLSLEQLYAEMQNRK